MPRAAPTGPGSGFDRVRPRAPRAVPDPHGFAADSDGTRALYSDNGPPDTPTLGRLTVSCERCGETTVVASARRALLTLLPSVHLYPLRRDHPSYLRCPACRHPSWVRLRVRV